MKAAPRIRIRLIAPRAGDLAQLFEVTGAQVAGWAGRDGVSTAEPLGISQGRLQALGAGNIPGGTANVAVFGTGAGSVLSPAPVAEGTIAVGTGLARDLGLSVGSRVALGGTELSVSAVVPEQWYSHTGVVWTTLADWRKLAHLAGGDALGTVIAVSFADGAGVDVAAANQAAGTVSATREGSFQALGSYRSENGSLMLMQAFLYGISALVIVAFLTVWTVQRTRDIAVLKAMGGSSAYVLKDAMVQAAVVLVAGAAAGGAAGVGGGLLAARAAPFLTTPQTTLLPVAGIIVLGLAGAALAVRGITRVDPLLALGGN